MKIRRESVIENTEDSLKLRIRELEKEIDSLKRSERLRGASDLSVLLSITVNLLETVDKRKALEKILEGAIQLIGLDTGAIYYIRDNELYLEVTVPHLDAAFPDEFRHARMENHPHILKAVTTKSSVLVNDIIREQLTAEEKIIISKRNMSSLIYIPLISMQRVTGVIILGTIDRIFKFGKREMELCHTISNIGSMTLENSLLFDQLNANIEELKSVITTKEKTEERLRLLHRAVEHSPVSIVVTNNEGSIEYVNPKFCETTGYSYEEAIGQNPRILKSGHHPDSFYKEIWETITSGKDWLGEIKNKKKNGEFCWESVLISPMTDEQAGITHFVGVKEDITEKKTMLEDLIKAKEEAEESNRLKTAFLHNISHEIRTPLNAIVGFSTFMSDPDLLPEKRQMYSDIIISSNDQLLSIIDGIMRISHLEAGQVMISETETNIKKLTATLFTQFQPVAAGRNLKFKLDHINVPEETTIKTDEGKLKQILSNLLDNAFKFTHKGYVEFGCNKRDSHVEFHVRDTGIGIPEEEHNKIFDRFYQVDKSKSQVYGGTGLGLSICAGYAELLGGTLAVSSKPGTGSVFTLRIPLQDKTA